MNATVLHITHDPPSALRLQSLFRKQPLYTLHTASPNELPQPLPTCDLCLLQLDDNLSILHNLKTQLPHNTPILTWTDPPRPARTITHLHAGATNSIARSTALSPAVFDVISSTILQAQHSPKPHPTPHPTTPNSLHERLRAFDTLSFDLSSLRSVDRIAHKALHALPNLLPDTYTALFLWKTTIQTSPFGILRGNSDRVQTLECIGTHGWDHCDSLSPNWLQHLREFQTASRTRTITPIPNSSLPTPLQPHAPPHTLLTPLCAGSSCWGALLASTHKPPTPTTHTLLTLLGQQLGMALESCALARDIEHARSSLESTNEHLIQSEKLAAVGLLAAGVAHEINNPSAFVITNLTVLSEYTETLSNTIRSLPHRPHNAPHDLDYILEDLPKLLARSLAGMKRIHKTVRSIKGFAHRNNLGREPISVSTLIENALTLASNESKELHSVHQEIDLPPNFTIHTWPNHLEQALLNLIINACHATDPTRPNTLTIRSHLLQPDPTDQTTPPTLVIEVQDTGIGIPKDHLDHIFEPFFTTRPSRSGTGLGLAIVHDIIQRIQGSISVRSQANVGTTFTIHLAQYIP